MPHQFAEAGSRPDDQPVVELFPSAAPRDIVLRGVRVNNLRDLNLAIPLGKWTVVTGRSGSGRASLVLGTLFAESRRRYIESFSTRSRRLLDRVERPDADLIENLPSAVLIRSGADSASRRRTSLAGLAQVLDHLRLLYVRQGVVVCPGCGGEVSDDTPARIAGVAAGIGAGLRYQVGFPVVLGEPRAGESVDAAGEQTERWGRWPRMARQSEAELRAAGFSRIVREETAVCGAGGAEKAGRDAAAAAGEQAETSWVIVDRLTGGAGSPGRVTESVETALEGGSGWMALLVGADGPPVAGDGKREEQAVCLDGRWWTVLPFCRGMMCAGCGWMAEQPRPELLNAGSPAGACRECEGTGVARPLADRRRGRTRTRRGTTGQAGPALCRACGGLRLRPEGLAVQLGGKSLPECCRMTSIEAGGFLRSVLGEAAARADVRVVLSELESRLELLQDAGLEHVPLDRAADALSAGEAVRAELAGTLAANVVDTLCLLEEPSAGLHQRDMPVLVHQIRLLQERGNTVVAIDHDSQLLRAADRVIELGPGAGAEGGVVVAEGTAEELCDRVETLTARVLGGSTLESPPRGRGDAAGSGTALTLTGARTGNLKNLTVTFPLGCLCVVTGVSGSGKTTLLRHTLVPACLAAVAGDATSRRSTVDERLARVPGPPQQEWDSLTGIDQGVNVAEVEPGSGWQSVRSIPLTVIGGFDDVRRVFADTAEAAQRGFTPGSFSFNSAGGGRCPRCRGTGTIDVDMQFLADVSVRCPECRGTRYQREVLEIRYRNLNLAQVLELSVDEAFPFFRSCRRLQRRLHALRDVGLGYLTLGRAASTLSRGESQRLRLAAAIARRKQGPGVLVLDEPAAGLHPTELAALLTCFRNLVAAGVSLIVAETRPEILLAAEHVIELGPGAGPAGGEVVACGTPEQLMQETGSPTGQALREQVSGRSDLP